MTDSRVAVIGLGNMGANIAHCLLDTGFDVTVHNRTPGRASPLVQVGAAAAESAGRAVQDVEAVVLSLSDEQAVEEVLFGAVAPCLPSGTVVIDTSTVCPAYARRAAAKAANLGITRVEACVIGNPLQARDGELRIVTAGENADHPQVRRVLKVLAQQVTHLGAPGMAATMKLVLNLLLGSQVASFAEALSYGERAGLDRETLLSAITQNNGFSSRVMLFRAKFFQDRDYRPAAFRARLLEKDLRLALTEAAELGLRMPVIERTADRFQETVDHGLGDHDAAAVIELQQLEPGGIGTATESNRSAP